MITNHYTKESSPACPVLRNVKQQFNDFILSRQYPCLGAKSALHNNAYHLAHYETLGTSASAHRIGADLLTFINDQGTMAGHFATFVATFAHPVTLSEEAFETLLWQQLTALHAIDRHPWALSASRNPNDSDFGFSFGGKAFFIVGLHARSSRLARRFEYPTLVFNLHHQFEQLRATNKFKKMQQVIRARDHAWQGSNNAMLADFGTASEARQYSGRAVPADWQCPFRHQDTAS